ncbi:hypothetical protein D3C73_1494080 [compost metagenome]
MKKMLAPNANAASPNPVSACNAALAKPTLERSMKARMYIRIRNGSRRSRLLEIALVSAGTESGRVI